MVRNPEQHRLSEAEHQIIFEQDIKPDLFADAQPTSQPVAIIFGGQPGAGKSAAVDEAMNELESRGGAVQIIGDDLRDYHPEYARLMKMDDKTAAFYTDRDTGLWVEKAIAEAKAQRVNIVIEGTMRDGNKVVETMKSLREADYQIDARALAVTARLSEQGIMQRYENQKADRGVGRMTTPEAHQAAYDGMLQTLDRIESQKQADRVTIYRRGAEVIYSNELQDGQWVHKPQARAVVESERARSMTLQELRDYAEGFDKLAGILVRQGRNASAEEISEVADLQKQAQEALVDARLDQINDLSTAVREAAAEHLAKANEGALGANFSDIGIADIQKIQADQTPHGQLAALQTDLDKSGIDLPDSIMLAISSWKQAIAERKEELGLSAEQVARLGTMLEARIIAHQDKKIAMPDQVHQRRNRNKQKEVTNER